jgi:hypothetical protein
LFHEEDGFDVSLLGQGVKGLAIDKTLVFSDISKELRSQRLLDRCNRLKGHRLLSFDNLVHGRRRRFDVPSNRRLWLFVWSRRTRSKWIRRPKDVWRDLLDELLASFVIGRKWIITQDVRPDLVDL